MKKALCYLAALVILAGGATSFAQETKGVQPSKEFPAKMCMCPMHKMMMKNMMKTEVVSTEDGGVVVLMGNKMVKYDKELNQVKEVELKMDMEKIKTMVQEQMKNCPMRQKMMESGGMMQGDCMHMKMMKEEGSAQ